MIWFFLNKERQNLKLVEKTTNEPLPPVIQVADEDVENELLIPRRPEWDLTTTAEELKYRENENYLKWRRKLALLQENDDIVLTPFEKNLEFWRQLWRVIERSHVLVQILDARNPLLFHCEDLDKYIHEVDNTKMSVVLLNKSDYLTEKQRKQWFDYFTSIGKICVFFSALEQQATDNVDVPCDDEDTDDQELADNLKQLHMNNSLYCCLSYRELILYFKSFRKQLNIDETSPITIGLVGYPNVGKSSTINALLRMKKVSVSAMPGKTKHFQTILIDDEITICDCPGLVFPNIVSSKAEMIINGILPIDQMKNALFPVGAITNKIPAHVFESLYGIILPNIESDDLSRKVTALELLSSFGFSRGFMTQRGLPDTSRAARYILKDFVSGKLLYCYAPPNLKQEDFHVYTIKNGPNRNNIDRKLMRAFAGNNLTKVKFDADYFKNQSTATSHLKGNRGIATHSINYIANGDEAFGQVEGKPWRKHNNRNKREKLRKVYAHLDTK